VIRAVVVDDELPARQSLQAMLSRTGEVDVVATCANAVEAIGVIKEKTPDVLFLDIQMPQVNGFQLLGMIDPELMPSVVFVTAYDEFAVKAFEESALDYLLKPVQRERLGRTIEKLKRTLGEGRRPVYASPPLERIPCSSTNSIRLVELAEVEYVHSGVAGVYVVTPRGEFFTELTLQVLDGQGDLVRCHKQYLVNARQIEHIVREGPRETVLRTKSGKEVPASRRYFARLKERLGLR
jgi:two-component system, LytTR family, response regulator